MRTRHKLSRLLLLVTALLAGCASAEGGRAEERHPPRGEFYYADGYRLHVLEAGAGRPVVLVHGSFGSTLTWTGSAVYEPLVRDYRVIAFDRPGHGYSRRPRRDELTPQDHARVLHALVKRLDLKRPIIVGHSWGGAVALAYAIEYPDDASAIVLISPLAYPVRDADLAIPRLAATPVIGDIVLEACIPILGGDVMKKSMAASFDPDPVAHENFDECVALALRPSVMRAESKDTLRLMPALDRLSKRYGEIRVPAAIVVGTGDTVLDVNAQGIALSRQIGGSHLLVAQNAGHHLQYTRPSLVMQAVDWAANHSR